MTMRDDTTQVTASVAAKRLGVTTRTLKAWRAANRGPAFRRRYGRVLYDLADLVAFEEAHPKIIPTA